MNFIAIFKVLFFVILMVSPKSDMSLETKFFVY